MKHTWKRETAKDNEGKQYWAYLCTECNYLVVAFNHPDLGGGSQHLPDKKLILLPQDDLTPEEAESACVVWGVDCV